MRKLFITICSLEPIPYLPDGVDTLLYGSPIYEHTFRKIKDASNKLGLEVEFLRASNCDLPGTKDKINASFEDLVIFASPLAFLARSKDIEGAIDYVVKSDVGYATVGNLRSLYMAVGMGKMLVGCDIASPAHFVSTMGTNGTNCSPAHFADGEKSVPLTKLAFLQRAEEYRNEMLDYLIMSGVEIELRDGIIISPTCEIRRGAKILQNTTIRGYSLIRENAIIGPCSTVDSCEIGEGSVVNYSNISNSTIESDVEIGPYTSIYDSTRVLSDTKIGSHCDISGSVIGNNVIISSHARLNECDIGTKALIGSGVITVNFEDKKRNNRCSIGDGAIIGNNTSLISPIKIGRGAFTAAGSVITDDVPAGALAIAREYQSNHTGWAKRRKM